MTKEAVLKKYFGYDHFRPLQGQIIEDVLNQKSGLVLMPTGGGKSLCFQIPALMLEGITVVISPLIALMKDQVESLRAMGIKASFINSSLSSDEQDKIMWAAKLGELKLLYIAPERLFQGTTFAFFQSLNISLFAIDEAHCISSWGHDFRPEYRQLHALAEFVGVPRLALTATADKVTRRDICKQLQINEEQVYISSFDRPNISLEVLPGNKKMEQISAFLKNVKNEAGIIYCLSRKSTETVAEALINKGFKVAHYHAGLSSEARNKAQESFINDDIQIIVATIAFGMGIDKSNVRWIIHYNLPSNVESYYQEIGRAGRDGTDAKTILFYSYSDIIMRQGMIFDSDMPEVQKELMTAKLERMRQYAESKICRRRILMSYFNEDLGKDCGNCDVCNNPREDFDATILAQKVLSTIARSYEKIGLTLVIDILRGSQNQNILKHNYQTLTTYGIGRDLNNAQWQDYLLQMLNYGVMDIAYDENHVFKLNAQSRQILKGLQKVQLSIHVPFQQKQVEKVTPERATGYDTDLFDRLKILRKQLSTALGMPAYIVFSDASLQEMARKKPISQSTFLNISGVGQEKYRQYGELFIKEILDFVSASKPIKMESSLQTLRLFEDGKGIAEIASERGLTQNSVVAHLLRQKDAGANVDLKRLIDPWDLNDIADAMKTIKYRKGDPLKPIFEHFESNVSYEKIKIAISILLND